MMEAERRIREALPFATPGRWEHVFSNGGREHYVYAPDAQYRRGLPGPVKVAWLPYSPGSNRDANDAAYIAACNPENIAALLAEIDRLTRERDEARAERDALAKDAERYRQLRRKACIVGNEFRLLNTAPTYVAPDAAIELDAVIDAQIEQERSEQKEAR